MLLEDETIGLASIIRVVHGELHVSIGTGKVASGRISGVSDAAGIGLTGDQVVLRAYAVSKECIQGFFICQRLVQIPMQRSTILLKHRTLKRRLAFINLTANRLQRRVM
jgi:hypothetical protein